MLYLVGKGARAPALAWPITATPIVVGRDPACAISLNDATVSRRHCQIFLEDERALVEDLGSRNATLVNGNPVARSSVYPGDEIAVGAAQFQVARLFEAYRLKAGERKKISDTSSVQLGQPLYSDESGDSLFVKGRPHTTRELAHLFTLGRELSQTGTMAGLLTLLLSEISEQFEAEAMWVVLCESESDRLCVLPGTMADLLYGDRELFSHVESALRERRSLLLPRRGSSGAEDSLCTSMISPIVLGRELLGALVAQGESPQRLYEEEDLEYLIAHAYAAAPYLKAMHRLERLELENRRLVAGMAGESPIIGGSAAMSDMRRQIRDAARSGLSVMILGETGSGKELVARMIHELSDLADKPLVVVNCAAIPEELFESEVFGHERGAFTGAHAARRGLLEECNGGALFLDEIGDLSMANQARLLSAIETGSFRRLGGSAPIQSEFRVIAATNKNLEQDMSAFRFRRDLYRRLNAFEIRAPALRERRSDIPELAEYFRDLAFKREGKGPLGFTPEALRALERYGWPGNVRELRNVIERAMVVAKGERIEEVDLALSGGAPLPERAFLSLEAMERRHIQEALRRANGKVKEAADLLGIGRSTLYRKIAEYGIPC